MFSYTTHCYDAEPTPNRALDIFVPDCPTRDIAVLFVHGGGWSSGTRSIFHPIMSAGHWQGIGVRALGSTLNNRHLAGHWGQPSTIDI